MLGMKIWSTALAPPLFAVLIAGCAVQPHATRPQDGLSVEQVLRVAAHGDWLVIRGLHRSDDAVAALTNMPLSHAGLLDHERRQVIEAERCGVHASALDVLVGKAERLAFGRPPCLVERGDRRIGRSSVRESLSAEQTTIMPRPDRPRMSPDRYYCTELVPSVYPPAATKTAVTIPAGGRAGTVISLGNHPVRLRAGTSAEHAAASWVCIDVA